MIHLRFALPELPVSDAFFSCMNGLTARFITRKEFMSMIVAFTGTRHALTPAQQRSLEQQLTLFSPDEVHHGDCIGADAAFDSMCRLID